MEHQNGEWTSSSSSAGYDRNAEAHTSFSRSLAEASSSSSHERLENGIGREDEDRGRRPFNFGFRFAENNPQHRFLGIPIGVNFPSFDESTIVRDSWSCVIVIITFWLFVSMTLILGVYGSESFGLGPYSSVLIQPNSLFVQSVKVEYLGTTALPGLHLYGLYDSPSLDNEKSWSVSLNSSVPSNDHKGWVYFLNSGSQINITYNMSPDTSSLFLIIAEGEEEFTQWVEDPAYPNTTLSWNVVNGIGNLTQQIFYSSTYYVAFGNLNSMNAELQSTISVKSLLYNTSGAYYECSVGYGECGLDVLFPWGTAMVLVSQEFSSTKEWYVKITYEPRWTTYILGIAGMTLLMLAAFNYLNTHRISGGEFGDERDGEAHPERAPLLRAKDDSSSCCSSYESLSSEEKDIEEFLAANLGERKKAEDGNNTRRLCAICYDAPRDCFFLPCGHCISCFDCGTRISEADGVCPVCHRTMKKVRKIFTV